MFSLFRYDIAIMKMNEHVEFTENINKICLPTMNESSTEFCYAVGFGMTDYSKKRAASFPSTHPLTEFMKTPILFEKIC